VQTDLFEGLRGRLIVSAQAQAHEPLHGAVHMVAMARAAIEGGAAGLRCEGPADIGAIRAAVGVPLIGLWKVATGGVCITPTYEAARAVVAAGADIVAIDATMRDRLVSVGELIRYIHEELQRPVMADVSSLEEGIAAAQAGADCVGPTLSGYMAGPVPVEPDWDLLAGLLRHVSVPVVMEGRIWEPAEAARALREGAWAVVVGSAITRPQLITRRFVEAIQSL
jgi:N-acylglucosamine-6-phosphate 2-epimerase